MTGVLYIRDVDDEVLDELKARSRTEGLSLSAYVARELSRLVSRPTNAEVFRRARQRMRDREPQVEEIVEALQRGRERDAS